MFLVGWLVSRWGQPTLFFPLAVPWNQFFQKRVHYGSMRSVTSLEYINNIIFARLSHRTTSWKCILLVVWITRVAHFGTTRQGDAFASTMYHIWAACITCLDVIMAVNVSWEADSVLLDWKCTNLLWWKAPLPTVCLNDRLLVASIEHIGFINYGRWEGGEMASLGEISFHK